MNVSGRTLRVRRILRPKLGMGTEAQAFFYTLVSRDTKVGVGERREV